MESSQQMIQLVIIAISILLTTVAGAFLFRMYRATRQRNYVVRLEDIASQVLFPANCPKCGMRMESGFIAVGNGIHWRKDGEEPRRTRDMSRAMPNTVNLSTRLLENKAWHCPRCKLLLLDYNYQIIAESPRDVTDL